MRFFDNSGNFVYEYAANNNINKPRGISLGYRHGF